MLLVPHLPVQIVPNHFDHEDEPSVLTATPCLPNKLSEKKEMTAEIMQQKQQPEQEVTKPSKPVPPHLLKGSRNFVKFYSL